MIWEKRFPQLATWLACQAASEQANHRANQNRAYIWIVKNRRGRRQSLLSEAPEFQKSMEYYKTRTEILRHPRHIMQSYQHQMQDNAIAWNRWTYHEIPAKMQWDLWQPKQRRNQVSEIQWESHPPSSGPRHVRSSIVCFRDSSFRSCSGQVPRVSQI